MTPAFRTSSKPMEQSGVLQPMSAEDEAFWRSRRGGDFNPKRGTIRLFLLIVALIIVGTIGVAAIPN